MEQEIHQLFLAREPRNSPSNIKLRKSPLSKSIAKGESRRVLYHYTSVDALFKILETGSFKFSRIDKVNDLLEKRPLALMDMYKRVFVACFSHQRKESIPLWKIYTNRGSGVIIGLFFKDSDIDDHFIDYDRSFVDSNDQKVFGLSKGPGSFTEETYLNILDVYYTDKAYMYQWLWQMENHISITPDDIAYAKSKAWSYEKETRIVLFHRDMTANPIDSDYI